MEETTNGLDQRLFHRMQAYQELVLTEQKVAETMLAMKEGADQDDNKLLSDAAKEVLPAIYNLMDKIRFCLVEIMLDGDPRYYGDEEE